MLVTLYIDSSEIEEKQSTKLLGSIIDKQPTWKEHVKHCQSKMACILYAMNSSKKNYLNSKVLMMLYYYAILYSCLSCGILL